MESSLRKGKRFVRIEKRRGIEVERVKLLTPSRAIDALIGDEEQNVKRKKKKKDRNREWAPNPATIDHLELTITNNILLS